MELFRTKGRRWGLVLAAGEGTRLRELTTRDGIAVPKQFCSLHGGPSLLQGAIRRAARHAPIARTVVVVASEHRRWWRTELDRLPESNVVVQPRNRGTAPGVLLPLLAILERDPDATVAIFPSDHYVADERTLGRAVEQAFEHVKYDPERVALLGIAPDAADSEYGWIVPRGREFDSPLAVSVPAEVERFVEKPPTDLAADLLRRGGVWNSFLLVARASTLIDLYAQRLPALLEQMRDRRWGELSLEELYERLSVSDFSRELMQGSEDRLRLIRVPQCGWTDLGTPARVAGCVEQLDRTQRRAPVPRYFAPRAVLDLAGALSRA